MTAGAADLVVGSGDDRLSRWRTIMGPAGLTAVFGMGTGGAPPVSSPEAGRWGVSPADLGSVVPWPPRWRVTSLIRASRADRSWRASSEDRGPPRGDPGSSRSSIGDHPGPPSRPGRPAPGVGADAASGRGGQAARLLGPVGCGGRPPCTPGLSTWSSSRSLRTLTYRKPRLEEGFALRCLQRLSFPDLATRRCPERDSRHTRGRSSPILSY